jgi:hypothetical protein
LIFSDVTTTGLTLSFTAATPAPSGYIAIRKAGSSPTTPPTDGVSYSVGATVDDATVAFAGNATTFSENNLEAGITYFYQVFSYNGTGASTNILSSVAATNSGSKITLPGKPILATTTAVGQNGFTVNWTATTGASGYRIDVSKDNFTNRLPGFDDAAVGGTFMVVTGLEPGVAYKYRLRAVNASGTSVNSDDGSQLTIPGTPVLAQATGIGQTGFTANWDAVNGATGFNIDVSKDDFSTFVSGYENKVLTVVTSEVIAGLVPGATYKYRVRSVNSGGSSPYSNPARSQLLLPATPVGLDATNATSASFKAKWEAIPGVTEFRLDVTKAADDFDPSLSDYNDKLITATSEELVANLAPNTVYKYRVRAVNASGTSPSSVPVSVSTEVSGDAPLEFLSPIYSSSFSGTASDISTEVKGGKGPYVVTFNHRKVKAANFTHDLVSPSSGTTYKVTINSSMLDDIGLEFYFKVTDLNGQSKETDPKVVYRAVATGGVTIPFTKSGGVANSYEIFSIPYELNDNLVASLFEELGDVDKSKWRLVRYQGGKNVDLGTANRIEPGKGYWFNRKDNVDVQFSGGTVVKGNQSEPFIMHLEKGWNQVGNPYPFDLDWRKVLNANPDIGLIGNLKVFNAEGFHLNDESATLKTWSGGFVHNGNEQAVDLAIPVVFPAGSRTTSGIAKDGSLDGPEWLVNINVRQGGSLSALTGIGMHPEASALVDRFDDFVVPRFLNYLEVYSRHDDFFTPKFSVDIVPDSRSYSWSIQLESSNSTEMVSLEWNNADLTANEAQLLLIDVSCNILVNMRTTGSYQFKPEHNHQFTILYGRSNDDLRPDFTTLGNPWPNPFHERLTLPFMTAHENSMVTIKVTDVMGRTVKPVVGGIYKPGIHNAEWDGKDQSGIPAAPGLYLIQMEVDGRLTTGRVLKY